jgi:glycosyltransferase involved in cell wall biosynthesis
MIDRIVIINDLALPKGGASQLAIESAIEFAARGLNVTYISGDRANALLSRHNIDQLSLGQQRLLDAPLVGMARGIYNGRAMAMVADWIGQHDSPRTVYHLHGWSQILSPSIFRALRSVKGRVIMTAHDFFLTCPNGAQFDYVAARPCDRKPLSRECILARCDRRNQAHKLWRIARHSVQRKILSGKVPPQLLIHRAMGPYFALAGLDADDMFVLPNPVTAYCEQRVAAEKNGDILFVGRIEETKGIDLAAQACRRAGTNLVAIGDGAMLEQMRTQYPEAQFLGRIAKDGIGAFARRARLLVMPSLHMEPFGLAAVEALWSGIPVVSSVHSLIASDIADTGAGLSVDISNSDALASILMRLAGDDELVHRMSLAAYNQTRHLALSPEAWIDALLSAYYALLERRVSALRAASETWMHRASMRLDPSCPEPKRSVGGAA